MLHPKLRFGVKTWRSDARVLLGGGPVLALYELAEPQAAGVPEDVPRVEPQVVPRGVSHEHLEPIDEPAPAHGLEPQELGYCFDGPESPAVLELAFGGRWCSPAERASLVVRGSEHSYVVAESE